MESNTAWTWVSSWVLLLAWFGRTIGATEPTTNPQEWTMMGPGFSVEPLSFDVTNVNDLAYDDQGRLWLLGYDGRIHIATDTDGDGLEETLTTYWNKPGIKSPLAMILKPSGVLVSGMGKIVGIEDTNRDGRGDQEIVVADGWEKSTNYSGGVDCLGMTMDKDGNLYFALGCADFTNAYLIKDGKAGYSRQSERGTIIKQSPDGKREIIGTGVRFGVALAFDSSGELFATDQEGETWLPGGNPLDELLHIEKGRHYGFPPAHPQHLPDVFDEPAVALYGPQHQSACGLTFDEPSASGKSFGPESWRGNALVAGYSRGKVWRTSLAKSSAGYVSMTSLMASARMLVIDTVVSPRGDLIVAAHGGSPDWGSGPTGKGKLFRVRMVDPTMPQVVRAWSASPVEVRVEFDRETWPEDMGQPKASIVWGDAVRAGDRFEFHRPGYESVQRQLSARRGKLAVYATKGALSLATDPHPARTSYALTLQYGDGVTYDLDYTLTGIQVSRLEDDVVEETFWTPHIESDVAMRLLPGSKEQASLRRQEEQGKKLVYKTRLVPWGGSGTVVLSASRSFAATAAGEDRASSLMDGRQTVHFPLQEETDLTLTISPGSGSADWRIAFLPHQDQRPRPVPTDAFVLPWAPAPLPAETTLGGSAGAWVAGNWEQGRAIFFSDEAQCGACHRHGNKGESIGPDLSNLIYRDVASVTRDIREPSASINPEYLPMNVRLKNGEVLAGLVRPIDAEMIRVIDSQAKQRRVLATEIEEYIPSSLSVMPKGLDEKLGPAKMRDLMMFLTRPEPVIPKSAEGKRPPLRTKSEIDRLLAAVESEVSDDPVRILLLAGPKDHDAGEHDYPAWQTGWKELLGRVRGVGVDVAHDWPSEAQFRDAQVIVAYFWNHHWSAERYKQIDQYLARGGGLVVIHSATIADKEPEQLAQRIGIAFQPGRSKYRHGSLALTVRPVSHPIVAGLSKVEFVDESYWPMIGELSRVDVLATADEEGKPWPMIWTFEPGQGRVFGSILGHYSSTFDDPVYRTVLARGIAWSARQPMSRLQSMVLQGVVLSPEE
jgi:putative heme-binding domain-containing protein